MLLFQRSSKGGSSCLKIDRFHFDEILRKRGARAARDLRRAFLPNLTVIALLPSPEAKAAPTGAEQSWFGCSTIIVNIRCTAVVPQV